MTSARAPRGHFSWDSFLYEVTGSQLPGERPKLWTEEAQRPLAAALVPAAAPLRQVPRWPPALAPRVTRPPAGLLRSAGLRRTQSACTLYTGRHPGRTPFTAPLSMARRGSQRRMRRVTPLRGPDAGLRSAHHAAYVRCAVCRAQQRYRAQQRSSRCLVCLLACPKARCSSERELRSDVSSRHT